MKFFKDELKKIRAFVFDVDGVLSHQSQNLTPDGELIRTSCTKDGYAIMYAIRKGYIIAVISGGGAPGVRERLEKLGVRPEDKSNNVIHWTKKPLCIWATTFRIIK